MKTQLSKPAQGRASYPEEYKQQALELWRASGRSAAKVAVELGIRPPLLYRWARTERAPKASCKPRRTLEELEAENRRLREENAKLLEGSGRGQSRLFTLRFMNDGWAGQHSKTLTRGLIS